MIKALFGELRDGRLARLAYLGYGILFVLVLTGLGILGGLTLVVIGEVFRNHAQQLQMPTYDNLGVVGNLLVVVISVLMMFVCANLQAKRWRDMGLPGWTTVAINILIYSLLSLLGWQHIAIGYLLLVGITLLFTPSDALAGRGAKA